MGRYSSHLYAWRFSKPNLTIGVGNARLDYCLTLMYPGFFFFFALYAIQVKILIVDGIFGATSIFTEINVSFPYT